LQKGSLRAEGITLNLKKRAIKGMGWVGLVTFITRASRFLVTLILAKLLVPGDFGVMAIGLLVVNILILFREVGVGAALIQKQDDVEKAASTAFILIIGVSGILFVGTCLLSNLIVTFFNRQVSDKIICLLAFSIVISAFSKTHFLQLQKSLDFKKAAVPEIVGVIGYSLVTILLAWLNYGVWSLVFGYLISELLRTLMLIIVTPWQPRLEFNMRAARELFGFGKYVLGSTLTIYLFNNLDQIFIGRFLGPKLLGFYNLGYRTANLPAQNISNIIGRVMFPVYSLLQTQEDKFRDTYLKTIKYVTILAIPVAFAVFVIGPHLFRVLYGHKWDGSIPVLQILSLYGLFRCFGSLTGSVFMAKGIPRWLWYISGIQVAIVLPFTYVVCYYFGIVGIASLFTFSIAVGVLLALRKAAQILDIELRSYVDLVKRPFSAALISFVGGQLFFSSVIANFSIFTLAIEIVVIGVLYLSVLHLLDRTLWREIVSELGWV
jgi:O-antigen/teichoic acid export membrane protein